MGGIQMATTTTAVPDQPPQQISSFGRLFGVLFNPTATFRDIAKWPTWLVPLALLTVLSIGVGALISQKMDWPGYMRQQDTKMSRWDQMNDQQKERMVDAQVTWIVAVAGPIIFALLLSLIYWGAFNVFSSAQLRFAVPFSIVSYSFVPGLLGSALALIVLSLKRYGDVDPQHLMATSVASLLPPGAAPWLVSLGTSLDLFWIWTMILLVIGFSAANPKKISKGTAFSVIFGLWFVYLAVKVGWSAISGI
jgi:hypothetical protein